MDKGQYWVQLIPLSDTGTRRTLDYFENIKPAKDYARQVSKMHGKAAAVAVQDRNGDCVDGFINGKII